MDLKDFYFQNIQKDEYHYRFYDSIENVNNVQNIFSGYTEVENYEFEVYDAEEAIIKFMEEVIFSKAFRLYGLRGYIVGSRNRI